MYCPSCGQENSTEQKFCRKCGLNLEKAAESLKEQAPAWLSVHDEDHWLELLGKFAIGGTALVGLVAVGAMVYTIVTKFILTGTGVFFGIVMSLLLIFAVLGVAYVALNEGRKGKRKQAIPPSEIEKPDTAKLLDTGSFEPIPSVIEDTTDLLGVEAKTRKL